MDENPYKALSRMRFSLRSLMILVASAPPVFAFTWLFGPAICRFIFDHWPVVAGWFGYIVAWMVIFVYWRRGHRFHRCSPSKHTPPNMPSN